MNGLREIGQATTEVIGFSWSHDRCDGQAPWLASRRLRMPHLTACYFTACDCTGSTSLAYPVEYRITSTRYRFDPL